MAETCCRNCRSAYQTCMVRHRCFCHIVRDHLETGGLPHRDPTAETAVKNVSQRRTAPKRNRQNR